MILYNWSKIFALTQGIPNEVLRVIQMITFKEIPKNKIDPIYKYMDINWSGMSFLYHPEVLCSYAPLHMKKDIAVYIALASLRSYNDFKIMGKLTLDLDLCPVDPGLFITDNKLFTIDDSDIHFNYEEAHMEKKH